MVVVNVLHTENLTKDPLCKKQKPRLTGNGRPEFLMAQEEGVHQRQRTPGESLLLDHIRAVCPDATHLCCSIVVCLLVTELVFLTGMSSLCLSDRLVCVFQRGFMSFVASAWRMWNLCF